jgi:hypothetical protein
MTNGLLIYGKYLRISSYIRKPVLIYNFETAPLRISLHMRKLDFFFSVGYVFLKKQGSENVWSGPLHE